MFCKNCGKELSGNAYICPDCGEPVKAANPAKPVRAVKTSHKGVFSILGFSLAIISIVFAVLYLSFNMITDLGYGDFSIVEAYYTIYIDMEYDVAASITVGIITYLITLVSLIFSIVGLYNSKNSDNAQEKSLSLAGVIICPVVLAALIACYCVNTIL